MKIQKFKISKKYISILMLMLLIIATVIILISIKRGEISRIY